MQFMNRKQNSHCAVVNLTSMSPGSYGGETLLISMWGAEIR
jgi:hypothetical protein